MNDKILKQSGNFSLISFIVASGLYLTASCKAETPHVHSEHELSTSSSTTGEILKTERLSSTTEECSGSSTGK